MTHAFRRSCISSISNHSSNTSAKHEHHASDKSGKEETMASEEAKKNTLVLYPSPGMGHLVSMFELGKVLARNGFAVTILIVEPHYHTGSTAPFIARVSSANPNISFHLLPTVTPPPTRSPNHEALTFDLLHLSNPNLLDFLRSSAPRALVIDFFCCCALDVAAELRVPCYAFCTSPACFLAALLHLPVLHSRTSSSFRELGSTPVEVPGIQPFPADHMPLPFLDREDEAYKGFLYVSRRLPEVSGIIINTFNSLEPKAIEAISAGRCVPKGKPTPPIYCIGPLIISESRDQIDGADCLSWLDAQPKGSVVFLCFGSLGLFSAAQLKEIATGLERSGQRFLWVVRSPPSDDPAKRSVKPPEPDLDALLPPGFLDRTSERGLVVKSWAPQAAVLGHEGVGGFVTHCGWNSVLEAVRAGIPMIAWPLYAEQHINKVFLVEGAKLAVEMSGYNEALVSAEEVEARVRWLMESEGGKELRERMAAAKQEAEGTLRDGGSSHAALMEVIVGLR